jgi:hypothetical protein
LGFWLCCTGLTYAEIVVQRDFLANFARLGSFQLVTCTVHTVRFARGKRIFQLPYFKPFCQKTEFFGQITQKPKKLHWAESLISFPLKLV